MDKVSSSQDWTVKIDTETNEVGEEEEHAKAHQVPQSFRRLQR